ncbi:MAG: hypothetical protein H6559_33070 [Lewinellaceae bacterium]|nr:hypothetical protein [Lewinellaceae bacterium]
MIDFSLDGVVPLESVYKFLGNPNITGGGGEVEIKRLQLNGAYRDMIDPVPHLPRTYQRIAGV